MLFDDCIKIILRNEGNFQCDPADIGNFTPDGILRGTKYGISARVFPKIDIKNLTEEQAKNIYFKYYWKPLNLDGINDKFLTLHIFDHAVNCGKGVAVRMLQRLVEVKADGVIGPVTKKAVNDFKPIPKVVDGYGLLSSLTDHYIYARYCYYTDLVMRRPTAKRYLKGWHNRISKCIFE